MTQNLPENLDFNYAVWTQGTRVVLLNVPWNNDYRDIVKFSNQSSLNTYLDSIEGAGVVINNLSYLKPNQPIRIDVPFNSAYRFNYLKASNPIQPISGDSYKDYYYFITDVRYVNPSTTEIVVQLDIWQTFGYDATFGNCYIERGHIGIANQNAFNNYGRDYLTIPEGLDIGGEYRVITKRKDRIIKPLTPSPEGDFDTTYPGSILVVSTVDLDGDNGTKAAPDLTAASGSDFNHVPSGASLYVYKNTTDFTNFMLGIQDKPWIGQGIVSVTMIPPFGKYFTVDWPVFDPADPFKNLGVKISSAAGNPPTLQHQMFIDWRNSPEIRNAIEPRYRILEKLLTFPYMAIEVTTWNGSPLILKPESWNSADAIINERISILPPHQRVTFIPRNYNSTSSGIDPDGDDTGDFMDMAISIDNFPSFPIINNMSIAYLASNKNGLAFESASADWSQQRAIRGNQTSYDQASAGMNLANELTGMGIQADTAQTNLNNQLAGAQATTGAMAGIIGGGAAGIVAGPAGVAAGALSGVGNAVMSGVNFGLQAQHNDMSLAIRSSSANRRNAAQVSNSGFVRDTNKNLADWASKGDYENAIAGINAKVQDARLIQPAAKGQFGGDLMNIIYFNSEINVRWKLIQPAAIRIIGEYWLRYGYAVRQFAKLPASLMVMSKFTYWKLAETYITSAAMPETFKQSIRGMFEKGVTVWADPADIGNIDIADNTPLGDITL